MVRTALSARPRRTGGGERPCFDELLRAVPTPKRRTRAFVVHSDREDVALSVALGFSREHVGVRVKYRDGSLVD